MLFSGLKKMTTFFIVEEGIIFSGISEFLHDFNKFIRTFITDFGIWMWTKTKVTRSFSRDSRHHIPCSTTPTIWSKEAYLRANR
ncbi:hypothetical protein F899_00179 [Acinetobacter sp. CIP 101934]|nr:hypothetical protein F899_00179 [Acinetobacter sp. CIP 101934]